jgi:hypothetical protein
MRATGADHSRCSASFPVQCITRCIIVFFAWGSVGARAACKTRVHRVAVRRNLASTPAKLRGSRPLFFKERLNACHQRHGTLALARGAACLPKRQAGLQQAVNDCRLRLEAAGRGACAAFRPSHDNGRSRLLCRALRARAALAPPPTPAAWHAQIRLILFRGEVQQRW